MTKIIASAQLKGGTGKSTITANLAGYLAMTGNTVLVVDADGPAQYTAFSWASLFADSGLKEAEKVTAVKVLTIDELVAVLEEHDGQVDYILIDAPPRMAEIMRAIIFAADLSIIPFNVTGPDIWALDDMIDLLDEVKSVKPDANLRLVINRLRDKSIAWQTRDLVLKQFDMPYIPTPLYEYDTYQTVIGKGLHVSSYRIHKPKEQFTQFAKEVLKALN